jgi:hypothetical protein
MHARRDHCPGRGRSGKPVGLQLKPEQQRRLAGEIDPLKDSTRKRSFVTATGGVV